MLRRKIKTDHTVSEEAMCSSKCPFREISGFYTSQPWAKCILLKKDLAFRTRTSPRSMAIC